MLTKAEAINKLGVHSLVNVDVQAGIPARDQTEHTESEIILRNEVLRTVYTPSLEMAKATLEQEEKIRNGIDIENINQKIINADIRLDQELDHHFNSTESSLKSKGQHLASLSRTLRLFKHNNNLERSASYPESKTFHYAFIFAVVVVEILLNSNFLAQGSELGAIGGFVSAAVIAITNTLFAFISAVIVRHFFHINVNKKIASVLSLAVLLIFVTTFILLVGHYRDSLQSDPFQASKLALVSFNESYFGINDFNAWVLVAISGLAYIVLVIKFLFSDDLYPEYGKLDRELKAESENWISYCKTAAEEANRIIDKAQNELSMNLKSIRTDFNQYKSSLERSKEVVEKQLLFKSKVNKLLEDVILEYQRHSERMMHYRAAYFGTVLKIDDVDFDDLNTVSLENDSEYSKRLQCIIDEVDDNFKNANEEINERRRSIQERIKVERTKIEHSLGLGEIR
ncbi:hypothetical protein GCM10025772_12150 [Ferrimonas gelatinilytica]|uniref:Uncharacterized protein n=2 Tax=Ferrimonas gelatinilytica TaxID=1255257 RepID=A0ABP9RZI9_9GAMM